MKFKSYYNCVFVSQWKGSDLMDLFNVSFIKLLCMFLESGI